MIYPRSTRFRGTLTAIDWLTDLGGYLGALSLLGILAFIAAEILSRNLFGHSIHFAWDVAGYLMGCCFLFACGSAMKAGSHVRVTALLEVLPAALGRVIEFTASILGLVICLALTWALVEMAWLSGLRGSTAPTSLRMPLVYPQSALALGAVILSLQCLAQILRLLRGESLASGLGLE
jgi:TRAP-type C4-dicarboxylate transport system permease small subunit